MERSRILKPAKKLSKHYRRINIFVTKTCRLILPDATQDVTGERAKLICQLAKKLDLHFEGQSHAAVALSIGFTVFPDQGATSTAILRAVDVALYRVKYEGRGQVVAAGLKAGQDTP